MSKAVTSRAAEAPTFPSFVKLSEELAFEGRSSEAMGAPKPRGGEEEARSRASGIREQAAQSGAAGRACFCQRAKNMSRDLETSRHDAQG